MPEAWDVAKVQKEFGPLKNIDRAREQELINEEKDLHILTLTGCDVGYDDLSDDDKPSDEEMELMDTNKEEYTTTMWTAFVGRRLVNVSEIYESAKPMPKDLEIQDDGVWFDEDGLPPS